jgi:hypothetical protein
VRITVRAHGLVLLAALVCAPALALGALAPFTAINQGPFYVSPAGSDSAGDGSPGNPWRQVQKAADWIRTHRINQVQTQDITVNVAAGTYAPFALANTGNGLDDGAHNGHLIKYVSPGAGAALIEAGIRITGWTPSYTVGANTVYVASVPNAFATVYENNVRSVEARYPNLSRSVGFTSTFEPYLLTAFDGLLSLTRLVYTAGDFTAGWTPDTLATPSDLRVFSWCGGFWEWKTSLSPVASIDAANHRLNMSASQPCKFNYHDGATASRYFLEGNKEMLDVPGEWYLDRAGLLLYYIPRDGPIASQTIVIPTVAEAITVTGLSQKQRDRIAGIVLDGFAVKHTDGIDPYYIGGWPVPAGGTINYPSPTPWVYPFFAWLAQQPQWHLGAIHLRNTDGVTIQNALIEDTGVAGIYVDGWGTNATIQNVWERRIGSTGIRFEGQFPVLGDWVNSNTVYNVRINNVGEQSGEGSGIELAQSGSNLLHYLDIFNGPRKGLWVLATTGQNAIPWTVYTRGNVVDHFHLHNLTQDSGDTGCLGVDSLSSIEPTVMINFFSQGIIDHCQVNSSLRDIAPDGILSDDETDRQSFTNIQVSAVDDHTFRRNTSTTTLVNTSFNTDGTVNGSFNPALMDTANIGVTSAFPWPCTAFDATGACVGGGTDPN